MKQATFLAKALEHLISKGKTVKFDRHKSISCDGVRTGGYYDGSTLVVACKNTEWFDVFVHEYCHFLQEQDETYEVDDKYDWCEYDQWLLRKKRLTKKKVTWLTNAIRADEMDCERRVVELIRKYKLPIDEKKYIQGANVYGLFYTLATKYRTWYKKTGPYAVPEILDTMPTEFKTEWEDVPERYEELMLKHCFAHI